ncbi:heat shock 75 mitochondrial [Labeo rohita]|uniref:Heat shock 75 mitochondrial n=1 Tax=Labeo rohita TaxID=84645 RepID=A0A498LNC7_LABRO|nr:heat shock 75 mitochondrial [Labeo rohita]
MMRLNYKTRFSRISDIHRPLKFERFHCPPGANNDTQQDCAKAFIYCLIPPIMWVIVLFLNGDYFSCAKTHWNGVYVFDEQLNRSWCKPIERTQNENELRLLTQKYIHDSQVFISELISNSSDALEKLRHKMITAGDTAPMQIHLQTDASKGTFTIQAFLDALQNQAEASSSIIGQFGVGFYSAFMVADKVDVYSQSAETGSRADTVMARLSRTWSPALASKLWGSVVRLHGLSHPLTHQHPH